MCIRDRYNDHGFKNLHIVDLDGALIGETVNLDIIQEIVAKFDLKIQAGGGVRNFENHDFYTFQPVPLETFHIQFYYQSRL